MYNFNCTAMKDPIELTNRFYIEMSRKVLSEKEYEVLKMLLIDKMTLGDVGEIYGLTTESISQIYEKTFKKVQCITEILGEIDHYKKKLQRLKNDFKCESGELKKRPSRSRTQTEIKIESVRNKTLYTSHFPFSKRMYSMFEVLDVHTIGELSEIPLKNFVRYRGFKEQCKKEIIAFIEFENIEYLFEGFAVWKKEPIEQLK